jgi:hypothetical protein
MGTSAERKGGDSIASSEMKVVQTLSSRKTKTGKAPTTILMI